jgi:hypothetical protein
MERSSADITDVELGIGVRRGLKQAALERHKMRAAGGSRRQRGRRYPSSRCAVPPFSPRKRRVASLSCSITISIFNITITGTPASQRKRLRRYQSEASGGRCLPDRTGGKCYSGACPLKGARSTLGERRALLPHRSDVLRRLEPGLVGSPNSLTRFMAISHGLPGLVQASHRARVNARAP